MSIQNKVVDILFEDDGSHLLNIILLYLNHIDDILLKIEGQHPHLIEQYIFNNQAVEVALDLYLTVFYTQMRDKIKDQELADYKYEAFLQELAKLINKYSNYEFNRNT